ncbi:MAG: Bax inhibitor-1 family protein [Clostridium fessum]
MSGIRPLLVGGLLFLILFGLLSMFLNLGSFETVLCYAGIVVFLGFTAYDTTKIRDNYQIFSADPSCFRKHRYSQRCSCISILSTCFCTLSA